MLRTAVGMHVELSVFGKPTCLLEEVLNSLELRNGDWISCAFLENVINLCNKDNKTISRGEERKTGKTPLSDGELAAVTDDDKAPRWCRHNKACRPTPWVSR